jgi:hypothetical protein
MYYGYALSGKILKVDGFDLMGNIPTNVIPDWRFLKIRDRYLIDDAGRKELLHHLDVGSRQMFKVFLLKKPLPCLVVLLLPALLTLLSLFLVFRIWPKVFWLILLGGVLALLYTQNTRILQLMDNVPALRKTKDRILKALLSLRLPEPVSYLLAIGSWIQLAVFDRLFLRYGRIRDVKDSTPKSSSDRVKNN